MESHVPRRQSRWQYNERIWKEMAGGSFRVAYIRISERRQWPKACAEDAVAVVKAAVGPVGHLLERCMTPIGDLLGLMSKIDS